MRQFASFGTAKETNVRFRYLLDHEQTRLSTAFDSLDADGLRLEDAEVLGEVGLSVAIDSLRGHGATLRGHPLDRGLDLR